jgi:hypothetical protein
MRTLTSREKQVLKDASVSPGYKWKVQYQARKKASMEMEDLRFLAEVYPEAIPVERLVSVIEKILEHGTIKAWDRQIKYLPPSFGHKLKAKKRWIKLAGVLRRPDGAPFKKFHIYWKLYLSMRLLRIIHEKLFKLSEHFSSFSHKQTVLELIPEKPGKISLRITLLDSWMKRAGKLKRVQILAVYPPQEDKKSAN